MYVLEVQSILPPVPIQLVNFWNRTLKLDSTLYDLNLLKGCVLSVARNFRTQWRHAKGRGRWFLALSTSQSLSRLVPAKTQHLTKTQGQPRAFLLRHSIKTLLLKNWTADHTHLCSASSRLNRKNDRKKQCCSCSRDKDWPSFFFLTASKQFWKCRDEFLDWKPWKMSLCQWQTPAAGASELTWRGFKGLRLARKACSAAWSFSFDKVQMKASESVAAVWFWIVRNSVDVELLQRSRSRIR